MKCLSVATLGAIVAADIYIYDTCLYRQVPFKSGVVLLTSLAKVLFLECQQRTDQTIEELEHYLVSEGLLS